jgi:hypothetical protein
VRVGTNDIQSTQGEGRHRRAVFLHYYAGLPAGQIGDQASAARVSLHKARRRLREYLTEHRPDLVPRRLMTTVRIASAEHQRRRRTHQMRSPSHLVVLIDDAGSRELPIWMLRGDGDRLERLVHAERGETSGPRARAGGYGRTGHVEAPYFWPVQAFADWAESHSAPGLTRCG